MINIFIGYDSKEKVAFNVLAYSILKQSTRPVSITPIYLKEYLLKKNKNIFVKYLSNVVSLQPNFKGDIQDETIKLFVEIKEKLVEKDIAGALNNLLLINDSKIYFNQWIQDAEYFIEFENTLNKLLY